MTVPEQGPGRTPARDPAMSGERGPAELILVARPEVRLRAGATGLSSPGADVSSLRSRLDRRGARLRPLCGLPEDRMGAMVAAANEERDGDPVPDLSTYYSVDAPGEDLEALAEELRADDLVEAAYVKPPGALPTVMDVDAKGHVRAGVNDMSPAPDDAPPATPDFVARQGYLNAAPEGIDARYAWTVAGGRGYGVRVIDCEWGWRFSHEDLTQNQGGVIAGSASSDQASVDHGTAVLGEISGDVNGIGIHGIAPDAWAAASSFETQSTAAAIVNAANRLRRGDILLLEIHRAGPNTPNPRQGQLGFIAIEWWPDDFAAIRYAVARGILVVEAAGNGFQDLDDAVYDRRPAGFPASWRNPFNPANLNSGAIVVGAGAPPPGTHGQNWGPDRSRLDFSNFGARVDAQGWGREVTTTGYGDLQGGGSQDLWYTDRFSGTSSASPIVVGALACLQGIMHSRGPLRVTPARARSLLRLTGSPQQDAPGRPRTQRIGNRPDLRQLVAAATRLSQRIGDTDGNGRSDVVVTSRWGIGILTQQGGTLAAPMMAPNGTRFGGWLLNTADNQVGPLADYDGDGRAEILVTSPWGLGILKRTGSTLAAPMMAPNGTRFGSWALDTNSSTVGPVGDFDGDRRTEIVVKGASGLGILELNGSTLSPTAGASNGTRIGGWLLNAGDNSFGPVGDFDGDGRDEMVVTSPWGLGILEVTGGRLAVPMMAPNGTRFGGWLLNTADNHLGPVGDFDGDGRDEILISSPWGVGILKLTGGTLSVVMMAPNGTRFGGWLLNTADNQLGPVGDFDGDGRDEILISSPWGVGILKLSGSTLTAPMMAPNGTRFGGWLLNTADNSLGAVTDYDGDRRSEILITSPWGLGVLELVGGTLAAPVMAPNGTRFGGWLLNTADNEFGN
jgi:hypothetical protein